MSMLSQTIVEPTLQYDFSSLTLGPPSSVVGGAHFTKLVGRGNQSLFVQTPKCTSKQGLVKSGKRMYLDLLFEPQDTIFIHWVEQLEATCQERLFDKSQEWFESALDKTDIENAFTSPFRLFRSGKYYLMRVGVKPTVRVYNEQHQVVPLEEVSADKHLVCIVEMPGIRFSSRNFQLEVELKQAMLVSPDPFLDACFIQRGAPALASSAKPATEAAEEAVDEDDRALIQEAARELLSRADAPQTNQTNTHTKPAPWGDDDLEEVDVVVVDEAPEPEPEPEPEHLEEVNVDDLLASDPDLDMAEEVAPNPEVELEAVDLDDAMSQDDALVLKKPDDVYRDAYLAAKQRAQAAAQAAREAWAAARRLRERYGIRDAEGEQEEGVFA